MHWTLPELYDVPVDVYDVLVSELNKTPNVSKD